MSLQERTLLGKLLDGFEEALEARETEAIERHRQALKEFLEHYDPGFDPENQGFTDDDSH